MKFQFPQVMTPYERFISRSVNHTFIINPDEKYKFIHIPEWVTDELYHPLIQELLYTYAAESTYTES